MPLFCTKSRLLSCTAKPVPASFIPYWPPLYLIGGSALLAWLFGITFERIHHYLGHHEETFSFVLFGMIAFATIMASTLKLSPVLVLLAAGLITRYQPAAPAYFSRHTLVPLAPFWSC